MTRILFTPVLAAGMATVVYVGLCVALPLAWGIGTELIFRWLERRHIKVAHPEDHSYYIDYHI